MIDFRAEMNKNVADNTVAINGFVIGKVTDDVALKIQALVNGTYRQVADPIPQSAGVPNNTSKPMTGYKDEPLKYEVVKMTDVESGKVYFTIQETLSFKRGVAHKFANKYISEVAKITKIKYKAMGKNKDGEEVEKTYTGYGFLKKKDAETAITTLPGFVSADDQNNYRANGWKF